jgi:hypothetical protein
MAEPFSTLAMQTRLAPSMLTSVCRIAPSFMLSELRFPQLSFSPSALTTSITLVIALSLAETDCACSPKSSYYRNQMRDFTNRPNQSMKPTQPLVLHPRRNRNLFYKWVGGLSLSR